MTNLEHEEEVITPEDDNEEELEEIEEIDEDSDENSNSDEGKDYWKDRALKAEETIEKSKKKQKAQNKPSKPLPKQSGVSKEEAYLYAKGLDFEEVEYAQKVAMLEDIPLTTVLENDLFKSWKDKRETQKKSEEAQLGSSKGSGRRKPQKTFQSRGLTDEEHKAMFNSRR